MSKPFSICMLLKGEGLLIGFSDGDPVIIGASPSDESEYSFQNGLEQVSVPANKLEIGSGGSSGTASASIPAESFDILGAVASGIVSTGILAEIRYVTEGLFWSECPLLFKGVVKSAGIDEYEGVINLNFEANTQNVNVDFPSSRVGDAGRFDNPPENTFDRVLPVVYGLVTKYSIPAVEFTSTPTGGGEVDVCLAAHVIYGSPERPGFVQLGNSNLGDLAPYYEVKTASDNFGNGYSYVTIPLDLWDDGMYARNVSGKTSADGARMESLGDIIKDLWFSYSGSTGEDFDFARSFYASDRLNRFSCGFAFTEADRGQTLFDVFVGRIGDLPVSFSSPIGMLGWDSTIIPTIGSEVTGILELGVNIFERTDVDLVGYDRVQNRFKVSFKYDEETEGNTASLLVDESNSGLCRESQSRYGKSQYISISIPDVVTPASAGAYLANEINSRAFPRLQVSYFTDDMDFLATPMLSVFKINDEDVGFSDSLFFLESVSPDIDNGGCLITLRSVLSSESTLIRSKS